MPNRLFARSLIATLWLLSGSVAMGQATPVASVSPSSLTFASLNLSGFGTD